MKITSEHFAQLKAAITEAHQCWGERIRPTCQDANDPAKRYRWDLLNCATRLGVLPITWVCDELYPYLNDDHIDTALRKIMKTL